MHSFRRLQKMCLEMKFKPEETKAELDLFREIAFAKKYGDDLLDLFASRHLWLCVSDKFKNLSTLQLEEGSTVLKPYYMAKWYKRNFNLNLKMSETRIFSHPEPWLTRVDRKFDVMIAEGPIYLKRRSIKLTKLVDGKPIDNIFPWRMTNDYVSKCCNTTSLSGINSAYWIAKWRGLMIDTCGTNTMAYRFLRYLHDYFIELWKGVEVHLNSDIEYYLATGTWPRGGGDLVPMIKKLSFHFDIRDMRLLKTCPTQQEIFDVYRINVPYLNVRKDNYDQVRQYRDPMRLMAVTTGRDGFWQS